MKLVAALSFVVALAACRAEGECGGAGFGSLRAGGGPGCNVELTQCGPEDEAFSADCDETGACRCFDNGTETATFTDAELCALVEENLGEDEPDIGALAARINEGCGLGLRYVP